MRIAVSGASGLIGNALVPNLRAQGHQVDRLVRRPAGAPDEISWDPAGGTVDLRRLDGVDAVVHLGGWSWLSVMTGDAGAAFAMGIIPFGISDLLELGLAANIAMLVAPRVRRVL